MNNLQQVLSPLRIRRFLAATDGSLHGEHAVAVARALAQVAGGEFRALRVGSADSAPAPANGSNGSVRANGSRSSNGGLPGVEVVHLADTWGADLVVLGRHQRTPEQPRSVGKTSDAVIRRRSGLSLFAPPEVHAIRRATIAIDCSPRGLEVVAPAIAFLNLAKAKAGAVCVLPGIEIASGDSTKGDPRSDRVSVVIGQVRLDSGPCELLVCWGDPVENILRTIRETRSDLLILGVRRGGQRGDSGSGYVGRELLKSAPCAVLTVPI